MSSALVPAPAPAPDTELSARVVESLVTRGDISGLSPRDKAAYYARRCQQLGLDPHSRPFAILKLNGKEVLYADKGAADQLAKIHQVNRRITDGPRVIDLAGRKLVFVQCEASLPNGRSEMEVATVPLTDPDNVLMKAVSKCKRRATLAILGLGMLDEMELETIRPEAQERVAPVDLSLLGQETDKTQALPPGDAKPEVLPPEESDAQLPAVLEDFLGAVQALATLHDAPALWRGRRGPLSELAPADRELAWKALCKKAGEVGAMKNVKVWLKKAIAEADAKMPVEPEDPEPPKGPGGGAPAPGAPANINALGTGAPASSSSTPGARHPTALAFAAHLAAHKDAGGVAGSYWRHRHLGEFDDCQAEVRGVVRDELTARGIQNPLSWLDEIGRKNGYSEAA